MTGPKPGHLVLPPHRANSLGPYDPAAAAAAAQTPASAADSPRRPSRVMFSPLERHDSLPWGRTKIHADDEDDSASSRAPIPSALRLPDGFATPLPALSMVVLSITMLGEFLSANVSTPFILDMVQGFEDVSDPADVATWTGLLVSVFFLTQFLTSLLWATAADRYGQRAVLFVSLLGSAATCALFGLATSLKQAMAIRLLQGIFAGAIGVARGCVTFITDSTNEGRAYAILGFSWGLGGVAGAIIGGAFESPAAKWPEVFASIPLFTEYPYLLPTFIAASITATGGVLSLFLAPDGGPRQGVIQLPEKPLFAPQLSSAPEEDEAVSHNPTTPTPKGSAPAAILGRRTSRKFSGYFGESGPALPQTPLPADQPLPTPLSVGGRLPRFRSRLRMGRSVEDGAGYGLGASYRSRVLASAVSSRRGSVVAEHRSSAVSVAGSEAAELNFAQKVVMANENAVTSIADLWVASAMNMENDDVFNWEPDREDDMGADSGPGTGAATPVNEGETASLHEPGTPGPETIEYTAPGSPEIRGRPLPGTAHKTYGAVGLGLDFPDARTPPRRTSRSTVRFSTPYTPSAALAEQARGDAASELASGASWRSQSHALPSIFTNPGIKRPNPVTDSPRIQASAPGPPDSGYPSLAPIIESRPLLLAIANSPRPSALRTPQRSPARSPLALPERLPVQAPARAPSMTSQLPKAIIAQYGLIALYTTTHDQVFLSYLVSSFDVGGLDLNPGGFAQIIALMSLAQVVFQFYLYPNIGPPRGRFSHLAMFRLGCALFIPSYITVTFYRAAASPGSGNDLFVMTGLTLSTAVRFCGNTFAFTSVSILLNYMSPPHVVGYANGIAQSLVSLGRFLGPVLGGYLWSMSIRDGPSGYALGFFACATVCALGVVHTFFIR